MKKYLKITMVCILLVGFLAGCTNKNENKKKQKNTKEAVQLMSPSELTTLTPLYYWIFQMLLSKQQRLKGYIV
ncbi:hypothetical protein ENFA111860_03400 [Enterococcus faecalis]